MFFGILLINQVLGHLIFSDPSVYTGDLPVWELEKPLIQSTPLDKWYCAGRSRPVDAPTLELVSGGSIDVPILCGEAPLGADKSTATRFCDNDRNALHGAEEGGCALSIKIGEQNFVMLSVVHECPKSDWSSVTFEVPEGLPSIRDAECAWSWRPPLMFAQPESYMNCFKCEIVGDFEGKIVGGTELIPNPDFTYRSEYSDGPFGDIEIKVTETDTRNTETPVEAEIEEC